MLEVVYVFGARGLGGLGCTEASSSWEVKVESRFGT